MHRYPQLKTQFKDEKHIAKTKSLQGLKTAGSPRHPFRPVATLGREAVASLKDTPHKSAILPRSIILLYLFEITFIIKA